MDAANPTPAPTLAPTTKTTTPSTTQPPPPTTTTTTTTIMTTELSSASPVTPESSNACVLASTLSATVVILFLLIAFGVIYFLRKRKKGKTIMDSNGQSTDVPKLPLKTGRAADFSRNRAFQSDEEYNVPPTREEPLPRKNQNKKENQPFSPYHGPLRTQEDYSVPPPRENTSIKPPLPPNLARKMQQNNKNAADNHDETGNAYYLDMAGIKDGLYQNIDSAEDNIYINN